nr:uncharacterized protein LOC127322856 isoform X8 [Lolium perenne]XP_051207231.1 uncharacterized protein LOC127322856 isoform X9 [Lolium perenne]
MASLCASWCWAAPVTVAAASPSTRPARVTLLALPRAPSPAPLPRIQLGRHPRDAFFVSRCQKGADRNPEPKPEPELEQPDVVDNFFKKLDKARDDYIVEKGWHADIDDISNRICGHALSALDLASTVMDMPSLGLGTNEISQQTVHQMVRSYATTFCKAAEDAYHKRVQIHTICSFFGALGCLGAIAHMLVEDTVANLEDGHLKSKIAYQLDTDYHQFSKKMNVLNEEIKLTERTEIVGKILLGGLIHAKSYVKKLIEDAHHLQDQD